MDRPPAYQPFYCEENIWLLAQDQRPGPGERLVVIITGTAAPSSGGGCTLAKQRAAGPRGGSVWWDYHVILLVHGERWMVWDLDTTLDLPILAESYLNATFPYPPNRRAAAAVRFRLVTAADFCHQLVSDRTHMRGPDGDLLRPPPPWPAPGRGANTLARFLDPNQPYLGEVVDLAGLMQRVGMGAA